MKEVKEQSLRNPDVKPTIEVISKILGEANNPYLFFISKLEDHGITLEWNYYNDGKAWLGKGVHKWTGARGGSKETTIIWLSIWNGFFKVTIYVPENKREEILELSLDNKIKLMISESKQMGKIKFFPICFDLCTDELFESIFILCEYKISIIDHR